jgi:hypothetical protein
MSTAVSSPAVKHKFAVRRHIEVVAVVCECGEIYHGKGVRKARVCQHCESYIITDKERRYRDSHGWLAGVDQGIYEKYQSRYASEMQR